MRYSRLLPLLVMLPACDVFDPDIDVVHGDVAGSAIQPAVSVPGIVAAGQPFDVDIQTAGNGCYSFQRTEVKLDGMTAEIRPFDRVDLSDPCEDVLTLIDHTVTLRFARRGYATVHVIGKQPDGTREVFTTTVRVD